MLNRQRQLGTVSNGKVVGTLSPSDAKIWHVVVGESKYATNGAQTTYLQRANPGVEDVKIGGAAYVWWSYDDVDGNINNGDYMKWARADDDGATGVATYAAIVMAATFALF